VRRVALRFSCETDDGTRIALKRLLRQTLATDADLIDVHSLSDYILEQNSTWGVGSTIKTEGTEADPYAVLGVLDLDQKVSASSVCYDLVLFCRARQFSSCMQPLYVMQTSTATGRCCSATGFLLVR
jgi:hypothetical protein